MKSLQIEFMRFQVYDIKLKIFIYIGLQKIGETKAS